MPAGKKKVLGKRKDELNGLILVAIVSLRAKVYAFIYLDKSGNITEEKTSKGTQRSKNNIDLNVIILKFQLKKLLRKL